MKLHVFSFVIISALLAPILCNPALVQINDEAKEIANPSTLNAPPPQPHSTAKPDGPNTTTTTTSAPSPITIPITVPALPTTTPAPPITTPNTTTSSTTPSTTTSTTSTTTVAPPHPNTTTSTTVTPTKPTLSTTSVTPDNKPTLAPTPSPSPHRKFDGPSFIGGIILACGLSAIGFVAFKFYKARTERNYHTFTN